MAFNSLLTFVRLPAVAAPVFRSVATPAEGVLDGPSAGGHYDEVTFRHFLAIERKRAALAERKCVLLLVRLRTTAGRSSAPSASDIFEALGESVREIDLVGWYRQDRVAAVLFAQGLDAVPDVLHRVVERIRQRLARRFSDGATAGLRLRIVQLGGPDRP